MTITSANPPQPEQLKLNPEIGDAMSKDLLGHMSDEQLFALLHDCCNPNCLVINEVIRRFKELEDKYFHEVDGP